MRKILGIFIVLMIALSAFAALQGTPFTPADDRRFDAIETLADGSGKSIGIQLSSGLIIVGDGSGNANPVAMSGDMTIANTGAVTVGASSIENSMLVNASITEAKLIVQSADGLHAARVARATLDCGTSSCTASATVGMGVTLPSDSIMLRAWYYTVTQFVDNGAGTVALQCEDAGNIDAAADITGISVATITQTDVKAGAEVNAIAAPCVISAVIATSEQTAGKLILFVEYVVAE